MVGLVAPSPVATMPLPAETAPLFHLLEINVISAQDLHAVGSRMESYAVAWVHSELKLSTRVDPDGHTNPTWNDKFVFRIDDDFLRSYTSAIMIEIYCLRSFRDSHIGTVRVLLSNLFPFQTFSSATPRSIPSHFVALQVRRPSGRPQGILNVGVALLDDTMRSMRLYSQLNASGLGYRDFMGDSHQHQQQPQPGNPIPHLRQSKSDIHSEVGTEKPIVSSIEVPESPSVVAAKVADEEYEVGSSVLEDRSVASSKDDFKSKLWKTEVPPIYDGGNRTIPSDESLVQNRHNRRKTDGSGGLFSCFGDSYGCECSFFRGMSTRKGSGTSARKLHVAASDPNMSHSFGMD
ncbi:uncharacterized protein [Aristolochia californica]|uniref:uncharacterized protein n=1 Tax=Aristolochia californica TaxID=171875 RepID=UPI0035D54478